jgi:hypothetical protein
MHGKEDRMGHASLKRHVMRVLSLGAVIGAVAIGGGCGSTKYLVFDVYEAPGQNSQARKFFNLGFGMGSYFEAVWAALEKNDVDGAIKLIEAEQPKSEFDYYNLAILHEVKHDWAKAEENIQLALKECKGSCDRYTEELAFIQEHKAKSAAASAAPPPK